MRRKVKLGFTLVEVALFLAITGILFVGIVASIQGSMFQQRHNDSVQSFAEFLRSVYSQTMNVENDSERGNGRTNQAIYGQLITFGESVDLRGNPNTDNAIFSYTVVGSIGDITSSNALESLVKLKANVIRGKGSGGKGPFELAGISEEYFPRWGAEIQTTTGWRSGQYTPFKGAVLIVRHPSSGTVITYVLKDRVIEVNKTLKNANLSYSSSTVAPNPIMGFLNSGFQTGVDVDFCVNPEGKNRSTQRRDIRIIAGARNASGVEVVPANGEENRCKE